MSRQQIPTIEMVKNIWKSQQQKIECLCPKAPSNLEVIKKVSQCYRCLQQFHSDCYWVPEKGQQFQCPFCYIRDCLPQKYVKNILFMGYLPIPKKQKSQYRVNFTLDPKIKADKSIHLQARCLKFNQKNRYEISWPDNGSFTIGKLKVNEFRPLQNNSPLKRRTDEPIKIDKSRLQIDNEIIIEQKTVSETGYKINKQCYHLIAIMVVQELSGESVLANFQKQFIPVNQSKQALKQSMNSSGEILIQKISVSLKCQYFGDRMKLPAKSRLCQTKHMQPFDLTNFIISSITAKTSTRRWKCPICDRRAYDLVIDKYILDLMNVNKDTNQIRFKVNGEPEMIEGKHDSESQDSHQIFKSEKNEKQQLIIDLDGEDVQPFPIFFKQILSNSQPVCLSDDDECELQLAIQQRLKTMRSDIATIKPVQESLLTKKRKINDGVTRIVSVPVPKFSIPIEISDSEDSESNHKINNNILKDKIEVSAENQRKKEQLLDKKSQKLQKNQIKKSAVQTPKFNPIINAKYQSFNKSILNAQTKRNNLKPGVDIKNRQISIIQVDSDHQQSTQQEVSKTLKEILYEHKKGIFGEGKIGVNEEDELIFKGIFQKMWSDKKAL